MDGNLSSKRILIVRSTRTTRHGSSHRHTQDFFGRTWASRAWGARGSANFCSSLTYMLEIIGNQSNSSGRTRRSTQLVSPRVGQATVNCASMRAQRDSINSSKWALNPMMQSDHVCGLCASSDVNEYDAIVDLRSAEPGENTVVTSALVILVVCSECGAAHFTVSRADLELLKASGAR